MIVAGPASRHVVVILPAEGEAASEYDSLCVRLHSSDLRTIVFEPDERPDAAAVLAVMDSERIGWAHMVGAGAGATVGWDLAATTFGRAQSLVMLDYVAAGPVPRVEAPATMLTTNPEALADARTARRSVFSDVRIVDLTETGAADPTAALASEIVLRTSLW